MSEKYLVAMGFRGNLDNLGVDTLEAYVEKDDKIRSGELKGHPLFTPLVESNPKRAPISIQLAEDEDLTGRVKEEYSNLCKADPNVFVPGPFGDFIEVHRTGDREYNIKVSHKGFRKPGLAADLAVVVKGKNEKGKDVYYLVTGSRRANPGKGKPAWLGGFRNIDKGPDGVYAFDSGAYTMLHEAVEEAGLVIKHHNPEELRTAYNADDIPVTVELGKDKDKIESGVRMKHLGTIATSDLPLGGEQVGGEALANGTKRVYATDGYFLLVDLQDKEINEQLLSDWLTPGDDIGKLQFHDITGYAASGSAGDLKEKLQFGIEHHSFFIPGVIEKAHAFYSS
jgi:hypothetical protein